MNEMAVIRDRTILVGFQTKLGRLKFALEPGTEFKGGTYSPTFWTEGA